MGLVLSRKVNEQIVIEVRGMPPIRVTVIELGERSCKLLVNAPDEVDIFRAPPLALREDRLLEQRRADGDDDGS